MSFWEDFKSVVREGFRLAGNLAKVTAEKVADVVLSYFRQVKKWSIRLFIAAVAPLVVIVPCLVFHLPLGGLYGAYVVFLVVLLAAELILITPMFLVWRRLKSLFPTLAKDLEDWVEFIRSVVVNGLALGIFVTLFPIWRAPGAFPLLLLVLACWLILPACAFSNVCKRIYPTVRGIQLLLLLGLLVLEMAFPRQMEQRGWATSRGIGHVISVKQKEVTSDWSTMEWFNNAGEPLVWYSGSGAGGYRLWAAPGFDPASGQQLKPVLDENTQGQITAALSAAERILSERVAAEQKRLQIERETVAKQAVKEAAAETRRATEESHRADLDRYLVDPSLPENRGQIRVAVVVQGTDNGVDSVLSTALATQLKQSGINSDGSVFREAFARDGLLDSLFSGEMKRTAELGFPKRAHYILVAKQNTEYTTNRQLDGIITGQLTFHARLISTSTGRTSDESRELASGAGFTKERADTMARERLIKQLTRKNWKTKPELE